jgi:hypothetical protein
MVLESRVFYFIVDVNRIAKLSRGKNQFIIYWVQFGQVKSIKILFLWVVTALARLFILEM